MVMRARYAGRCGRCGGRFGVGAVIDWDRGTRQAVHATNEACEEARAHAQAASEARVNLGSVIAFLTAAKERGLKMPKLRVLDVDGSTELRLSLTVKGVLPGSVSVKRGGAFAGVVRPDGVVAGPVLPGDAALQQHLLALAADPVAAARAYAALTCRCSFCSLPLTDAGSVEVGYGPVCAEKWGLPHKPKGTPQLAHEVKQAAIADMPGLQVHADGPYCTACQQHRPCSCDDMAADQAPIRRALAVISKLTPSQMRALPDASEVIGAPESELRESAVAEGHLPTREYADLSDLGLSGFPAKVTHAGRTWRMRNVLDRDREDEVVSVLYGCGVDELVLIND